MNTIANQLANDLENILMPDKFSEEIMNIFEKYGKHSKVHISNVLIKYFKESKKAERKALENLKIHLEDKA